MSDSYNQWRYEIEERFDIRVGEYCIIHESVKIGKHTVIKNFVELREGTEIGEDCFIDSGVKMSGECKVGNRTVIRYDSIIARGVEIGDDCYICPQVMFNNLDTDKQQIGGATVKSNCFIGTNSTIQHGIEIAPHTTIGAKSFVNKDIQFAAKKYMGIPAKEV